MSDIVPTTDGDQPAGTGGDQPAATQQPTSTPTATDDKTVTLREEDYKNLISQRDRANNLSSESEAFVLTLAKEREIDSFLEQHKDDYPDVSKDDLMSASDPSELEALAQKMQRRVEDIVQKKLLDVQKAAAPVMTPQEREAELKRLRDNPGSASFGRMLELQQEV